MKFFIDTANLEDIQEAVSLGIIHGATTNPAIIIQENTLDMKAKVQEVIKLIPGGEINTEVLARDTEGMIREAREINSWGPNMVVKIPMTWEGIKAVKQLSQEGIKTTVTIVFTPSQALLAAMAGATYVAAFVGRSNQIDQDGFQLVENISKVFKANPDIKTEILAAAIVLPSDVIQAAQAGAQAITMPLSCLKLMSMHPATPLTLDSFLEGWEGVKLA